MILVETSNDYNPNHTLDWDIPAAVSYLAVFKATLKRPSPTRKKNKRNLNHQLDFSTSLLILPNSSKGQPAKQAQNLSSACPINHYKPDIFYWALVFIQLSQLRLCWREDVVCRKETVKSGGSRAFFSNFVHRTQTGWKSLSASKDDRKYPLWRHGVLADMQKHFCLQALVQQQSSAI